MVIGLYRSQHAADGSSLPFVYTCPKADTILRGNDRIFVYCNPIELKSAVDICLDLPFVINPDGSISLAEEVKKAKSVNDDKESKSKRGLLVQREHSNSIEDEAATGTPKMRRGNVRPTHVLSMSSAVNQAQTVKAISRKTIMKLNNSGKSDASKSIKDRSNP